MIHGSQPKLLHSQSIVLLGRSAIFIAHVDHSPHSLVVVKPLRHADESNGSATDHDGIVHIRRPFANAS